LAKAKGLIFVKNCGNSAPLGALYPGPSALNLSMNGFEHFARQRPDAPYLKGRFHSKFPRGQTALIDTILKL